MKIVGTTHCKMCGRKMAVIGGHKGRGMGPTCLDRYLSDVEAAYKEHYIRETIRFNRLQEKSRRQAEENRNRRIAEFIASEIRRKEELKAVAQPYQFPLLAA